MNREEINALEAAWRRADTMAADADNEDVRLVADDAAAAILVLLDVLASRGKQRG